MSWLAFTAFGVVVGLLSGIMGIGGGMVLVPGLVMLFGFSQLDAQGTSLAVLSVPILIFAASIYYQTGHVRLPVVLYIAMGVVVGASLGAKFAEHLPVHIMRMVFGGLLLYVGFLFVLDLRAARPSVALPAGIAALVTAIIARIFHLRLKQHAPPEPPSADREYYI